MPRDRSAVVAALKTKGFAERTEGKNRDHDTFFFMHGGLQRAVFTKVSRGSGYRTIGDDLLGKMARLLQLSRSDFNLLVECPLAKRSTWRSSLPGAFCARAEMPLGRLGSGT